VAFIGAVNFDVEQCSISEFVCGYFKMLAFWGVTKGLPLASLLRILQNVPSQQ